VFCEEARYCVPLSSDFELFVGVLLDGFDSSVERRTAFFAGVALVLPCKTTRSAKDTKCGGCCDDFSSQRFHRASILAIRHLCKQPISNLCLISRLIRQVKFNR
jgi:hypothetical protein